MKEGLLLSLFYRLRNNLKENALFPSLRQLVNLENPGHLALEPEAQCRLTFQLSLRLGPLLHASWKEPSLPLRGSPLSFPCPEHRPRLSVPHYVFPDALASLSLPSHPSSQLLLSEGFLLGPRDFQNGEGSPAALWFPSHARGIDGA